jgi:molybdopterin converting factor small subunit
VTGGGAVRVQFPPVLRVTTNGQRELTSSGRTIREALDECARQFPALKLHLFDEAGRVRRHILCIHNDSVVRAPEMAEHQIQPGDEIILANAFAGG